MTNTPRFRFDVVVPGTPDEVWARLWDLDRHTRHIPLTVVDGGPLGPGVRFTGRTGVGTVAFDDVMEVTGWTPPHRAVIDKVGRVLGGRIEVVLMPQGDRTRLQWRQEYAVRGVPDRLARLVAPVVGAGYRRTVRRITRPV
jgi:carbon monoxide dehydrogenase subunit G